jgi:hypothetical protein
MSDINKMKALTKDFENLLNEDYKEQMQTRIKVTNPFSGQSAMLTEEENKLYLSIKLAELEERYETMQKQLSKFSRLNPKAYMTLLD